jgi:hypothetical protein
LVTAPKSRYCLSKRIEASWTVVDLLEGAVLESFPLAAPWTVWSLELFSWPATV